MIDFHCHLDLYDEPARIVAECRLRRMYVLTVTTTPSAWRGNIQLVSGSDRIRVGLGLHPQLVHQRKSEVALFDELLPRTRYVGEIGLDGGPEYKSSWEDQLEVFDHILKSCADAGGRILSIHSRRAAGMILRRLEEHASAGTAILHWYSGSPTELQRAIRLGCWFSVGPAMTQTAKGKSLIELMPRDRVLTETDGPFAMVGGVKLLPWDVQDAVSDLAEIWGISDAEAEQQVTANARSLLARHDKLD